MLLKLTMKKECKIPRHCIHVHWLSDSTSAFKECFSNNKRRNCSRSVYCAAGSVFSLYLVYFIPFNPCSNPTRQVAGHSHFIANETKALKSAQGHLANKSQRGPYKVRFPVQIYHTTPLKPWGPVLTGTKILSLSFLKLQSSVTNFTIFTIFIVLSILYIYGVGNGNPLQYSCLENSTDRGA